MNQKDVEKYLRMVGEELQRQNQAGEIVLLGGAVMLISVGNRNITDDVDVFLLERVVLRAAQIVASRQRLPEDWLNHNAYLKVRDLKEPDSYQLWKSFPGLDVHIPCLDYVFAAKLYAAREKDKQDIVALANKLGISKQRQARKTLYYYVDESLVSPETEILIEELFK